MKCTLVNLSSPSTALDRPSLTPELMAAVGARYSRNNEGLEKILSLIDPENPDKSVDSIFRMIDYGHASIGDMSPVAIFIDGVSLLLGFWLWYVCPTARGQESSTRYVKFGSDHMLSHQDCGIAANRFYSVQGNSAVSYEVAYRKWNEYLAENPEVLTLPTSLTEKERERISRNYAFDRARVFLPLSTKTNLMMIMSARKWVDLISYLLSFPLAEFNSLGEKLKEELGKACPRMVKHAVAKESTRKVIDFNFAMDLLFSFSLQGENFGGWFRGYNFDYSYSRGLKFRENRYDIFSDMIKTGFANFGWKYASFGEIRDLNRHATGNKKFSIVPNGFRVFDYCVSPGKFQDWLRKEAEVIGYTNFNFAVDKLREGDLSGLYLLNLGHTFYFEHSTTLDHFIYEAELRTGKGAHFAYSAMLKEVVDCMNKTYPEISSRILLGQAEPE